MASINFLSEIIDHKLITDADTKITYVTAKPIAYDLSINIAGRNESVKLTLVKDGDSYTALLKHSTVQGTINTPLHYTSTDLNLSIKNVLRNWEALYLKILTSQTNERFLCERCNYPAQNETEFFDPDTNEHVANCPNCKYNKTTTQKLFDFKNSWDIIHGTGTAKKIHDLGGVYIKLDRYESPSPPNELITEDISPDISLKLNEKITKTKSFLNQQGIPNTLRLFNVKVIIHAHTVESG